MIKIIRCYTTEEGEPAVEFEIIERGGVVGRGDAITEGKSDAEMVAILEKEERETAARNKAMRKKYPNPSPEPPPPGSLVHRMQSEAEVNCPFLPLISEEWTAYWEKKWAEEKASQQPAEAAQ